MIVSAERGIILKSRYLLLPEMFTLWCLVDNNTLDAVSFRAEHGVAFAIETLAGHVLFYTGQSEEVLAHNAAQMGLDLHQIDALALSHALSYM